LSCNGLAGRKAGARERPAGLPRSPADGA